MSLPTSGALASQQVLEVAARGVAYRASQLVLEAAVGYAGGAVRASQLVIEVLATVTETPLPLVYPELVGVGYSWIRRPIWSTGTATGTSGREVRVGYWSQPLWEWDLTYEYLPDTAAAGSTSSDYRTLLGFYGAVAGSLTGFYFRDPDDYYIQNQFLGTGDGTTTTFIFIRNYGLGSDTEVENIGGLTTGQPVTVRFGTTTESSSTYTISTATPMSNTITFATPPAAGVQIFADFSYWFWCRFKEDTVDFEKFMSQLWLMKTITIKSLRN